MPRQFSDKNSIIIRWVHILFPKWHHSCQMVGCSVCGLEILSFNLEILTIFTPRWAQMFCLLRAQIISSTIILRHYIFHFAFTYHGIFNYVQWSQGRTVIILKVGPYIMQQVISLTNKGFPYNMSLVIRQTGTFDSRLVKLELSLDGHLHNWSTHDIILLLGRTYTSVNYATSRHVALLLTRP